MPRFYTFESFLTLLGYIERLFSFHIHCKIEEIAYAVFLAYLQY